MTRGVLCGLCVLCAACGSSTPTAPSTTTTTIPQAPATYTIAGTVTATNGGQALSGLSVTLNGQPTTTNGSGGFTYSFTSGSTSRLTLTDASIVPRALTLNIGSARSVAIGAIGLAGFDLNFYRELVRNGFEAPTTLQPLRRWTVNPNIYLKTVDEDGAAIDARTLDTTEAAIRETASAWTGGTIAIAGLERGIGTKAGVAGWITVRWPAVTAADRRCGQADVGVSGGAIDLFYKQGGGCRCAGVSEIRPLTVRHELGHALGYWHTGSTSDLMSGLAVAGCDQLPSARELAAAAIAYARPVGNVDPDSDPTGTVNLSPMTVR